MAKGVPKRMQARARGVESVRGVAAAGLISGLVLALSACGLRTTTGPTCAQLLAMSDTDQTTAIVGWAKQHDKRVDQSDPNGASSGFALFQDRASLMTYCGDTTHRGDHIGELAPSG